MSKLKNRITETSVVFSIGRTLRLYFTLNKRIEEENRFSILFIVKSKGFVLGKEIALISEDSRYRMSVHVCKVLCCLQCLCSR